MVSYPFKTNDKKRVLKTKTRKLTFASHIDAAIFAYYAVCLQKYYEKYILEKEFSEVVTAYRKVQSLTHKGNKCNIDFAYDVFNFIRKMLDEKESATVITFDIKGFFDNLDHKYLKDKWKEVMNINEMPNDVYIVYKHVTRYSFVNENQLYNLFKDKILCKKRNNKLTTKK